MAGGTADIISLTPSLLTWLDEYALDDVVTYFDPDAIYVPHEPGTEVDYAEIRNRFEPIVFYPELENKRIRHVPINGIDFVVIDGVDTLDVVEELEATGRLDGAECVYLLTTDIDVELDTTDLTASLVNEERYLEHAANTEKKYVYLTGALQSNYHEEWSEVVVRGVQPEEDDGGLLIPQLTCHTDGRVSVSSIRSSQVGIKALRGVGRKTKEKLNNHGYETRADVAAAQRSELTDIYGIGDKTANKIWYHSRALTNGEIKRRSNYPVPGTDPVFITIEADGVTPTIIWSIAAYDAKSNTFEQFVARDPAEKGAAVKSFISWYAVECEGQTIVSWKGWEYDYIHLARFIAEHAPEYAGVWDSASKRDLYFWAVEQDNAVLPGRTDDIIEISTAAGYDVGGTGLTSAQVRRDYRKWMTGGAEPDWSLMKRYSRNNLEALVRVYDEVSLKGNVHPDA